MRYLIDLMSGNNKNLHPKYFNEAGRDDWAISVTTLRTSHRGTTIIDVLESLIGQTGARTH